MRRFFAMSAVAAMFLMAWSNLSTAAKAEAVTRNARS